MSVLSYVAQSTELRGCLYSYHKTPQIAPFGLQSHYVWRQNDLNYNQIHYCRCTYTAFSERDITLPWNEFPSGVSSKPGGGHTQNSENDDASLGVSSFSVVENQLRNSSPRGWLCYYGGP